MKKKLSKQDLEAQKLLKQLKDHEQLIHHMCNMWDDTYDSLKSIINSLLNAQLDLAKMGKIYELENETLYKKLYDSIRAYNGLVMLKDAAAKVCKKDAAKMKKLSKLLPENQKINPDDYENFRTEAKVLESGKTEYTFSISKKKNKQN